MQARVRETKIFERGRVLLVARALRADASLHERQAAFTPSHVFSYQPSKEQIIIALSLASRDSFEMKDFQFFLDGRMSESSSEFSDLTVIEHHYAFAFPYQRVFLVTFSASQQNAVASVDRGILEIHSPVGMSKIKLAYSDDVSTSKGANP